MSEFDCDLFVIGGGSGGVRAARMSAQLGARVVLAEPAALGGTCVNVGCVPKKLYSYAAHYREAFDEARGFGWDAGVGDAQPRLDWERLKAGRAREVGRLNALYTQALRQAGVRLLHGWARLADAHTVCVRMDGGDEHAVRARHILVATGGRAHVPAIPGHTLALTSDGMFDLAPFPRRLAVVGAGYIACEFASIFRGLGAQVSLLARGTQVLRGFDDEVRERLADGLRGHGIDLRCGTDVVAIERGGADAGVSLVLGDGTRVAADAVLMATGRVPNVDGLGLQALGVAQREDGAIVVDAQHRTSVPSIHAIGDVTARLQLTPVATAEAMALADQLFGSGRRRMDYDFVPTAVFTSPNVGTVGYGEAAARERFGDVAVFCSEFRPLRQALGGSAQRVFMKLLVEASTDRVVGVHMVGPDAGEVVQGFAVALKAGATKAVFDATIGIHPTMAEEFVTMRAPAR